MRRGNPSLVNGMSDPAAKRALRRKKGKNNSTAFDFAMAQVALSGMALFLVACCTIYYMLSRDSPSSTFDSRNDDVVVGETSLFSSRIRGMAHRFQQQKHRSSYELPEAMEDVGDKTDEYLALREEYDLKVLPEDDERSRREVERLRLREYTPMKRLDYDIYNCPLYPPKDYPTAWKIPDVLDKWSPDDPTPHTEIYQGLCVFDYESEYEKAQNYQEAELPFVLENDPAVLRTAERWNYPGYMQKLLGAVPHRTEYSANNHFMYWMAPKKGGRKKDRHGRRKERKAPEGWTPPTKMIRMPYEEWIHHANVTDDKLGPDQPHWYYRLIGCGYMGDCDKDSSEYLFDELPFFQPKESIYVPYPDEQKGIHCRFGMKGVIAENHFDGSRNMIALMGGERRYILAHPDQCDRLALYPKGHPSGRHSAVDWSDPDYDEYPEFADAYVNEVVMQAGQVLYLPTNWFHYIISLSVNFQCNTRSGIGPEYMEPIQQCGF